MLQNAYFLSKIGADTAEKERTFANLGLFGALLQPPAKKRKNIGNYPTGRSKDARVPASRQDTSRPNQYAFRGIYPLLDQATRIKIEIVHVSENFFWGERETRRRKGTTE